MDNKNIIYKNINLKKIKKMYSPKELPKKNFMNISPVRPTDPEDKPQKNLFDKFNTAPIDQREPGEMSPIITDFLPSDIEKMEALDQLSPIPKNSLPELDHKITDINFVNGPEVENKPQNEEESSSSSSDFSFSALGANSDSIINSFVLF